ncbi:hypothetical protein BDF21DRAFT_418433 [Thamnidium elegans]|uniref:F-box domain-containing protein n=1 Tax=Thamnidium elegans TaxID=101142 RepID=A0A8H7SSS1_9FUNG|nr:hypothetical protein INT48_008864 [Thamnidium elegans]KAI8081121.1 hypothetical protein BDF21DRAFT_418433 [Thamnidium elegans]
MFTLPADVLLHIFSFFPLSDLCHLLKKTSQARPEEQSRLLLNFYVKQVLLARIKHEAWDIVLDTPSNYFAILCNRDMITKIRPIARLSCVAYNSTSEYLRFEINDDESCFEMTDDEIEFQSMRIYCAQWFNLFKEDDRSGQIKLLWREGDQTKQIDDDLIIGYRCTKKVAASAEDNCRFCSSNNRCNKHAFISTPSALKQRLLQVHSIRVSLDWLRQGLTIQD